MTVGFKAVQSEYNRQYKWPALGREGGLVAGCPSFKVHVELEPPTQHVKADNIELGLRDELPNMEQVHGSPSKDLHLTREPSFTAKKRVPGASPERHKTSRPLAKKAGLAGPAVTTERYKSEYTRRFSPVKKGAWEPATPLQSSKSNFVDSKTNLPIGKKPADKVVRSEYSANYADPTGELRQMRELYQLRRKQLELEKRKEAEKEKEEEPAPVVEPEVEPVVQPEVEPVVEPVIEEPPAPVLAQPIRRDRPKVRSRVDLISPVKPSLGTQHWRSEYKTKYDSPEKGVGISAFGRRVHPYRAQQASDRVSALIKPDVSETEAATAPAAEKVVDWYQEVTELRRLAEKFKAKSHGSHFSSDGLCQLAFSSAQLRESVAPASPKVSEESVHIIPTEKSPKTQEPAKVEDDVKITDLEEEDPVPDISNLVIKTVSVPVVAPAPKPAVVAEEEGTPRVAERSFTLFEGRVPTPKFRNQGSRHHLDRTTKISPEKPRRKVEATGGSILEGRVTTPKVGEIGGSRHHLDATTPLKPAAGKEPAKPAATEPEKPSEPVVEPVVENSAVAASEPAADKPAEPAAETPAEPTAEKAAEPTAEKAPEPAAEKAPEPAVTEPAPEKAVNGTSKLAQGTAPFEPLLPATTKVRTQLNFSTPKKQNGWSRDLDGKVLSRASSCSSLAGETLQKAKKRGVNFWK